MIPRLWIDVEDLFEYARTNPRPSGIQRVAFEIYQSLQARYGTTGLVCFIRHTGLDSFRTVHWSEIAGLFRDLTVRELQPPAQPRPILPHSSARQLVRKLVHWLPPSLRVHLVDGAVAQRAALRAWGRLLDALLRDIVRIPIRFARRLRPSRATSSVSDRQGQSPVRTSQN